jgi:hypothetical protein
LNASAAGIPAQRRQISPAHARTTPKSCSKPSCAIEGAAALSVNMTPSVNPLLSHDFATLFQTDHMAISLPSLSKVSFLVHEVAGPLAHVRVSKTAKIK